MSVVLVLLVVVAVTIGACVWRRVEREQQKFLDALNRSFFGNRRSE